MEVLNDHKSNMLSESNSNYKKVSVDLKEEFIMNNNRKVKIKQVRFLNYFYFILFI
jgi:hypothetical protein